ncbi:MAG: hypothetical protein KC547_07385, partial [Anaerolineae bacterium]|nr:hypothetical protein [Anaerolineae bacterium]
FDLNLDGIDEFSLHVSFDSFSAYLILQRDPNETTGYRLVETPLPWLDQTLPYSIGLPTDYSVEHLGDITGDTLPEWLVFAGSNSAGCGILYILTWQAGALVDLAPEDALFCLTGEFVIENRAADALPDIVQTEARRDNWQCEWSVTHRLDWNGTRFDRLDEPPDFDETLGCALHQTEPLLWANRAGEAIPLYEAGLAAGWAAPTDDNPVYFAELEQYARARLALAFALDGHIPESRALLVDLMAEDTTSTAIDRMITAMAGADTALDMCVAAYNVWAEYAVSAFDYRTLPITAQVGRDRPIGGMMDDYPPEPEKAGCNAPPLIDARLAAHTFTTDALPAVQLDTLGIGVLEAFSADFDADGADEWLIWLDARVNPILFVPENGAYALSGPALRRPNDMTSFGVQPTPGQDALLFVDYAMLDFTMANVQYFTYDVAMVYCDDQLLPIARGNQGDVRLWRLRNGQFEQVLTAPLCQSRPMTELFSADGTQLHAAAVTLPSDVSYHDRYGDVVYTWNPAAQTYTPPAPAPSATPAAAVATSAAQAADAARLLTARKDAFVFLRDGHPESALTLIDETLAQVDPSAAPSTLDDLYYYRALALEALNRPDEALAEYVAIYEAAPESAWGMLAALHIEGQAE